MILRPLKLLPYLGALHSHTQSFLVIIIRHNPHHQKPLLHSHLDFLMSMWVVLWSVSLVVVEEEEG